MRLVVGISGASGIVLAKRLLEELARQGVAIELVITPSALHTASLELERKFATPKRFLESLSEQVQAQTQLHPIGAIGASICSGSYRTEGMVVIPCSMSSLAAISYGMADNCLKRAADVTLKEKRPLVLVPREAPLSALHLENMLRLAQMGATLVPPVPAWYTLPKTLEDVENFIVGKTLEALRLNHSLYPAWPIRPLA